MLDLNGSLQAINLPALIQMVGQRRATGRLEVTTERWVGELGFVNGRLVSARCGGEQGLSALATILAAATEGQFVFIDSRVSVDGSSDGAHELTSRCPKLGFADDHARHYSRPTALHRCYATQPPSSITTGEQRDLCLGGGFARCARFVGQTNSLVTRPAVTPFGSSPETPARAEKRWPVLLAMGCVVLGLAAVIGVLARLALIATTPEPDTGMTTEAVETPLDVAGARATVPALSVVATAEVQTPRLAATRAPSVEPTRLPTGTPSPDVVLDNRFAGASQSGWLEKPPLAGWSDGAYRLFAREPARFVAVDAPGPDTLGDVLVSATMRKTGGPPGGGYGLIVRAQGAARNAENQDFEGYVFECGDVGEFGIWRREGDHWVDLVPWTHSPNVRTGGSPNDLSIQAVGSHFGFTVNGTLAGEVDDDTVEAGAVGVFVGGDLNQVAVDRFSVERAD